MAAISSNGLYRTRTLFAVELHPSTVSDVLGGVKEQLNAHLLRYVDEFDGVLVAYSNVQILTKQPVIHPYFPYFHLDVRADVLLFKPSPGMNLVARVNHLGEDYISALALGVFNVTIPARAVMPELHFLREENKWIHKVTPQHQIHEHSYIVFRVEDVKDNGGFFQISGSMREPATGAADFLHPGVQLPEPPAGWPDPVASPREDEDGDVVMVTGGEGATPSGRGLAALAAATAAAAAANGKPAHAGKQKHGKEGKDGKGSKREHGASGEEAAKKRRKTDAGAVPAGGTTPGAVVTPAAAAAATPAAAATGPDAKKDKKDKSDKKKEKEEKKKEKEEKKKQKEEKKKGKTEPPVPAQSAPPQMGAATAAGAAPSTAGPAHTTGAMANGVAAPAATPQPAAGNGATPAAEASKKKDKKEKKEKKETSEKKEKEKSSKKEKEKTGKKDKKTASR